MKTLLAASLIGLLTACATPAPKMSTLPEGLGNLTATTPIACRFEKQSSDGKNLQKSNWYFWRQASRTETRDELTHQGEIWEKNRAGQLSYSRLFFKENVALDYFPGDLVATGMTPTWQQVTTLVEPKTLGKELALVGKEASDNTLIEHYSGTLNGVVTEIDWLPSLQLPAKMEKKLPEGIFTLTLSECGNGFTLSVKPLGKTELDNFRHIDYTDLGDMEDDPMVKHLEQLMGSHHHQH